METMFDLDVQVSSSASNGTDREYVTGSCFCSWIEACTTIPE